MSDQSFFETFVSTLDPSDAQALRKLRLNILQVAPSAVEGTSSGVPAFTYKGKYLASLNATKTHLALYVMRGTALKELKPELSYYDSTNVAIRFTASNQLPTELVQKIIRFRMSEINNTTREV